MPTPLNVTQQYDAPVTEVFALFNDPDNNVWMLQDLRDRLPGRV